MTWPVTARDWNTTTRVFVEPVADPQTGVVTSQPHTVIEVGNGLNFLDGFGKWQPSQDVIALTAGGGAAATNGPTKVLWSAAGLNDDAALTFLTASNLVLKARVLGVYYFDPSSGESKLLAAPSDSAVLELLPPNQVVYRSAFSSDLLQADLRYTYTRYGFESDVILTAQPKLSPADCGLDPATTLLQVRHQWIAPMPQVRTVTVGSGCELPLTDQLLDFGDLWFPQGRAFLAAGAGDTGRSAAPIIPGNLTGDAPVGKEWQQGAATSTLIESVAWACIAPKLAALPLMAAVEGASRAGQLCDAGALGSGGQPGARRSGGIELAQRPYSPVGLVLDYITLQGNTNQDQTFSTYVPGSGPTYFLEGPVSFSGTVTFQAGCVVKYQSVRVDCGPGGYCCSASLIANGAVTCQGTQSSPSILTSMFDSQYGEIINNGWSPQLGDVGTGLYVAYVHTGNLSLSDLVIRYATTAIQCQGMCSCSGGPCFTETVANCSLYECATGVYTTGANISIQSSAANSLTTPLTSTGACIYDNSGSFSQGFGPDPVTTAFQVPEVQPSGNIVTFSVPDTAPTVVSWYSNPSTPLGFIGPYTLLGTGSTLSVNWTQLGPYGIFVSKYNPFGTNWNVAYYLALASDYAYNSLMTFVAETNGQTTSMWVQPLQAVNPPGSIPGNYQWNPHSILYNKGGFTAISQLNYWNLTNNCTTNGCPGQDPMTALTRRHVISSGHSFVGVGGPWAPLNCGANGVPFWFCDANNNIIQMTAVAGYGRDDGNGDYSVFILNQDLPWGISPMWVDTTQAEWWPIYLQTDQFGQVAAYTPGFPIESAQWLPPFNNFTWGVPGDSGSPTMLLTASGQLVLVGAALGGPYTEGEALNNIQADMNLLITYWNTTNSLKLNPANYQMQYWNDALGPVRAP